MSTEFGTRLKLARKHKKLTQEQLSRLVPINQSALSQLETGGYGSMNTVQLALACGVNPLWLETGDGEMVPAKAGAGDAASPVVTAAPPAPSYMSAGDHVRGLAAYFENTEDGVRKAAAALVGQALERPETALSMAGMIDGLAPKKRDPWVMPKKQLPAVAPTAAMRQRQSATKP